MKKNFKFYLIFLILFCFPTFVLTNNFANLGEIQKYAKQKDEFPPIDNLDRLKPDYSSLYQKENGGFFKKNYNKILRFFRLKEKPIWSAKYFKSMLTDLTRKRELDSFTDDFIIKFTPKAGSRIIIWGDLHGAFHSFSRDLEKIKQLKIINEQLKIIKSDDYFVFNGNLIDQSPYSMETLTLALKLMEVNPGKVFYLRGTHESKEHWHNFGLKRELQIRAKNLSSEEIPLSSLINRFFNTLPLALFLKFGNK